MALVVAAVAVAAATAVHSVDLFAPLAAKACMHTCC